LFEPRDSLFGDDPKMFGATHLRRLVRAAGNIRIILLGWPGAAGARRATRPIATGTFSFPALSAN
jgi:hypothetical protein